MVSRKTGRPVGRPPTKPKKIFRTPPQARRGAPKKGDLTTRPERFTLAWACGFGGYFDTSVHAALCLAISVEERKRVPESRIRTYRRLMNKPMSAVEDRWFNFACVAVWWAFAAKRVGVAVAIAWINKLTQAIREPLWAELKLRPLARRIAASE